MNRTGTPLAAALLACAALAAAPAAGDDDQGQVSGQLRLGYRTVDVGGAATKFREDLDLDDGPRLFGLRLEVVPAGALRAALDRFELDLGNLGGDPFETFHLGLRKNGRFDFRYDRTEATYFYHDTILPPALASVSLSSGGDFHTFDFERVRDVASLRLTLSPRAGLDVGFERFTRRGESTTTLDIQRDEFELDRPIDESYDALRAAFSYAWPKATLVLEERFSRFENAVAIFLPGASQGENPDNATELDFFFLDQPYDYQSFRHTVRLNARPGKRWRLRAAASLEALDLDLAFDERSQGTTFAGQPTADVRAGDGEIGRDLELIDLDIAFRVNDRVALTAGGHRHQLDQDGELVIDGEPNRGVWDIETSGAELGVEVALGSAVTLAGGVRVESRDAAVQAEGDGALLSSSEETTHEGFFASLGWRPSRRLSLDVEAESSSYDDPFAFASPTDRSRVRVRLEHRRSNGLFVRATYQAQRLENDLVNWRSDRDHLGLRVGYRSDRLQVSGGYARFELDRAVEQEVTTLPGFGGGVTFLFPVRYDADTDLLDARLRWRFRDRCTLGGDLHRYDNGGSFAAERLDVRAFVDIEVGGGYLLHLGLRQVDYDEDAADFDDYDADIAELAIGYRW